MKRQELAEVVRGELARIGVAARDILVVAVSGGPDSMVLLDLLRKLNYRLIVAHVNHGLRREAEREEKLVQTYCAKHNLEFTVRQVDLSRQKTAIEERARELRYAALAEIARRSNAQWIVTAHTADDQVETVIANWLRGSLVRGLGGMRAVNGNIVRPLLGCWKIELLNYAKRHKLKYATDKSNDDIQFTRNRIRHQLLPELRKFNSRLDENLRQNSLLWQQVDVALMTLAGKYLKQIGTKTVRGLTVSISKLRELTPLMQVEVMKLAVGGEQVGIGRSHFLEVMKLVTSPRPIVAKRRLGGKLFASKAYDKITIGSGSGP